MTDYGIASNTRSPSGDQFREYLLNIVPFVNTSRFVKGRANSNGLSGTRKPLTRSAFTMGDSNNLDQITGTSIHNRKRIAMH
jgi:hypothetical protein